MPEFERQYKKNPRNASINHWLGVCLFYEGKYARAEKYLIYANKKEVRESAYYLARLYYIQYRGAEAIEYALDHMQKGDILLLLGKGHEHFMKVNGEKIYFSELDCIANYMKKHGMK